MDKIARYLFCIVLFACGDSFAQSAGNVRFTRSIGAFQTRKADLTQSYALILRHASGYFDKQGHVSCSGGEMVKALIAVASEKDLDIIRNSVKSFIKAEQGKTYHSPMLSLLLTLTFEHGGLGGSSSLEPMLLTKEGLSVPPGYGRTGAFRSFFEVFDDLRHTSKRRNISKSLKRMKKSMFLALN